MLALEKMSQNSNTKALVVLLSFTLPIGFVIPYALVATNLRALQWVWQAGYRPFWISLGVLLILASLSSWLLWRLNPLGATLYRVGLLISFVQTTYLAMMERQHFLLVVIFSIFAIQVFFSEKMKKVLRLPFYESRRAWWEAYPKGIPSMRVELLQKNGDTKEARLSNLGPEGCYVFLERSLPKGEIPVAVKLMGANDFALQAEVDLMARTKDGLGLGLRFRDSGPTGDWSKDLFDHLGQLRGAGYEIL